MGRETGPWESWRGHCDLGCDLGAQIATHTQSGATSPLALGGAEAICGYSAARRERSYYPSIGVFTVDGTVAGAYARIGHKPLIDDEAQDIAVLIAGDGGNA